jgi:hypothetical protein
MSSPGRRIATLLALCRALEGRDDPQDQPARHPIGWPRPIAWTEVLTLSSELMVGPALWCAIHDSQDWIPTAVVEQLSRSHLLNNTRNLRLRRSLRDAVQTFNKSGIVPLLLNGALQLVDGTPRTAAERWIVGLDLLVPGDQMAAARGGLESLGYEVAPRGSVRDPHALTLVRARSAGPIENAAGLSWAAVRPDPRSGCLTGASLRDRPYTRADVQAPRCRCPRIDLPDAGGS